MTDLQNVFLKLDEDVEGRFSQSRYMKDRRQWAKDVATLQFSIVCSAALIWLRILLEL